jgi:hypothetical protein
VEKHGGKRTYEILCRPVISHRLQASPEAGSSGPEAGPFGPEVGSFGPEAGSFGPEVGSALPEIGSPSVPGSGRESRFFQTSAGTCKASELNQIGEVLFASNLFHGGDKHHLNPGEHHFSQLFTSQVPYLP